MNFVYLLFLSVGFAAIQCLIGGTRLLFSFPTYACVGTVAVLSIASIRRAISPPSRMALFSAVALAGYVLVRAYLSENAYLSWPDFYMAGACLAVYLITALYLNTRHRLWLIWVFIAVAALAVGVGVIQFGTDQKFMIFPFMVRPEGGIDRASGLFISGNHFAGYLEAVALICLSLTLWSRWQLPAKFVTGYMVLMCYLGVVISGSRGGYISSASSLLVFCALCIWISHLIEPKRTVLLLLIGVTAVGIVLAGAATMALNSRMIRSRLHQGVTTDVRRFNWLAAVDQFKHSPWVGTGAGTHLIYGRLFRRPQLQSDPVHAHGDYLELLAEYGIAGEALALLFLGTHLASGLRGIRQIASRRLRGTIEPRSDTLAVGLGGVVAVCALAVHSVVDFNMHIPGNALFFAFLFGTLANPGTERPDKPPGWTSPEMALRLLLLLLGAGLLALVLPKLKGELLSEQARIALRDKKYSDCLELAKQASVLQPLNHSNFFYSGEANRVLALTIGMPAVRPLYFQNALESYRKGLKLFPNDVNLLVRCGQTLDGLRRYTEAEECYRTALKWDPNLGLIHAYYAAHLHLIGSREEEKKARQKASELSQQNVAEIGMAEAHSLLEDRRAP